MELRSFRNYVDVDVMSHRAPFTYAKTVRHSVDMSSISSDLIMRIKEKSGLDFSTRSRWVLSESTRRDPEGFVNFLNNQGFEVMQFHSSVGHIPQVVGMLISSAV